MTNARFNTIARLVVFLFTAGQGLTSDLTPLNNNGECTNLNEGSERHNYISLAACINLCESERDCAMVGYYDKLLSDDDSRCYMFNRICHLSQNVGNRANTSHIFYKNQFSGTYCVDYPNFADKYTDNCDAYVTHGFCANGTMTDKATSAHFEAVKDPIHGHTASQACCPCGGGKYVFERTAVSFIHDVNAYDTDDIDDQYPECTLEIDTTNTTQLASWNNFALYQLAESIADNDLFIYSDLLDNDPLHRNSFIMCDFSWYYSNGTDHFFIFASIERSDESLYFMNSKYFNLDLNVLSAHSEVEYLDFDDCNAQIYNASESDVVDTIIPCFMHYKTPIVMDTTQEAYTTTIAMITTTTEPTDIGVIEKYVKYIYPISEDNWMYSALLSVALCVFLSFCCVCVRKRKKKKEKNVDPMVNGGQKFVSVATHSPPDGSKGTEEDNDEDHYHHHTHSHPSREMYDSSEESNFVVMDVEHAITMQKEVDIDVEPEIQQNKNGILYQQSGFYDEKQMKNISHRFVNNPKRAPLLLFGDNIADKKRAHGAKRQKFGNQSQVLGRYDRWIGFGVPTTFDNAKSVDFDYNLHNYKALLQFEFDKLRKHLLNGCDVVVPCPSANDLSSKRRKYFNNGRQVIHHNIGTGISNLSFGELCLIENHITELKQYAREVKKVHQALYHDGDDDGGIMPDRSACGVLVFQFGWYSNDQMEHIYSKYSPQNEMKKAPKMLFGDNDIDFGRNTDTLRQYNGGQAAVMGAYDRLFAYGIVTTFYGKRKLKIGAFMHLMDKQFALLKQHLLTGYDVVIPTPTKKDVQQYPSRYVSNQKQVIFHNIGTGIASLPFAYSQYIQTKITELKKYARGIQTVKYYDYSPPAHAHAAAGIQRKHVRGKSSVLPYNLKIEKLATDAKSERPELNVISGVSNEREHTMIYECPFCSRHVHYLMKFHNCNHSLCSNCLSDYVFRHLNYVDNNEPHRFKCWAASNGKCQGRICLQDVHYPRDRCTCDECTSFVTPTGNGTILDDESYKQFKNIMTAFGKRSKWDTDECPDCGRPFAIPREWRDAQPQNETNAYHYGEAQVFFADVIINPSECNCCGKPLEPEDAPGIRGLNDSIDEKEENALTAYRTDNGHNCRVCHHYYCDECRSNCFYEVEQNMTVKPPTPVAEARYEFNAQIKLQRQDSVEYEHSRKRSGKHLDSVEYEHSRDRTHHRIKSGKHESEPSRDRTHHRMKSSKYKIGYTPHHYRFELCEICWYRFYCRRCPHCEHQFCGICDAQWNGCTANWIDKYKDQQNALTQCEEKYDGDSMYKLIDEKNGKHDTKSHHSCEKEMRKIQHKKKKEARTKEQQRRAKVKAMQARIADAEKKNKQLQIESARHVAKCNTLRTDAKQKQHEQNQKYKDMERQLLQIKNENQALQRKILQSENGQLKKEKDILKGKAHETEQERLKVIKEKDRVLIERERYRMIADDEKQKKLDAINQFEQFKKKMYVFVWQWQENDGKWKTYDDQTSKKIEDTLKVGDSLTFTADNDQTYQVTRTESDKGTQRNTQTEVKRNIRRKQQARGYIVYPAWWNMEGLNMSNEGGGGRHIGGTGGAYSDAQLIKMNLNDPKAREIAQSFYATSKHHPQYKKHYPNIKIILIESVQNQRLYDKYWSERSIMIRSITKEKLNEKDLWHGTNSEDVMDVIIKEGFRKEFNHTSMWGKGTYFAVHSGYSVSYSSKKNGVHKMFQCKVLCGEHHTGSGSYSLDKWPKKNGGKGLKYDSLVSNDKDIYVIHDDVRAYPTFVVTFKLR